MCGFTGFFTAGELDQSEREDLYKMTQILYHRGPDGYGYHFDKQNGLAMGHARLSIIDLESGQQPIISDDGNYVLTVNGEFYDYKRIRAGLALKGHQFVSKSDSEIAIKLYQEKGLNFFDELRGEFAFALFDEEAQRLILARDRYGIKPIYYHVTNNSIYFASEIKALFQHRKIDAEFSHEGVLHQLMHTMVPGSTMFKDIHAIQPGHFLIIDRKKGKLEISEKKYWDIDFQEQAAYDQHEDESVYIEGVREKLAEAVNLRLEADVPVGAYLSGGIDSCSILGLATVMQQSPVKAYTISFDHDSYDESHIAKEKETKTRADHEILNLKSEDLYGDNYVRTLWHAERCFYNTLGVAKYCMSRAVNQSDYKVVITGEGSDEIFAGYPQLKRDMYLYDKIYQENQSVHESMNKSNKIFQGAILAEQSVTHESFMDLVGFTPSWIQPWINTLATAKPLLADDILDSLNDYDPVAAIVSTFDASLLKNRHPLDVAQYTWSKTMLECQILNWGGDRVDMANSMESRPAFLDHKLTEYAYRIPPRFRINQQVEKYVLREAMKHVLPERLYKREKFAFMAPPSHTEDRKRGAVQDLIDDFMSEDTVKEVGIFDSKRVSKFLSE
ncbi:MAG: asparagine synthase (glutamine-hydrolyzing), partial [Calditrichaeota bacterium]|nr:asparagine synthase (glutamine-hydrolyzing) [Calditrichota bacterium]